MKLPDEIYSPTQLSELTREVQLRVGQLRDAAVQTKVVKKHPTELPAVSTYLEVAAQLNTIDTNDGAALEQFGQELDAFLKKAPVIRLTLAGWPDAAVRARLVQWFRAEISQGILIRFGVRSDIAGGIIVQTESHRLDLSYRELLINNRHKLSELAFHAT